MRANWKVACRRQSRTSASGSSVITAESGRGSAEQAAGYLRLMSILGHELRTPLTVVRGAATLVLQAHEQLPRERLLEMLQLIDDNSQTMAERIEDMLSLSHLDAGDLRLNPEDLPVSRIVQPALESARRLGQTAVRAQGSFEAVVVRADLERSIQALRSLLGDAVKDAEHESEVELQVEPADEEVRFAVEKQTREQDAERREFLTSVKGADQLQSGADLGLYLAWRLSEAMGGRVGVDESAGASRVWFTLRRRGD